MSPLKKRQPGEHVRKLFEQRQKSAVLRYALAIGAFIGGIFLFVAFRYSFVGIISLLGGVVTCYHFYQNAQYLMKRAGDAERGAQAETKVASLLLILQSQGWKIEYNLRIKKWGDADVVLCSPKENLFVVDVKSHGGTKVYKDGSLRKQYGKKIHDFREGDLISKVKGQALEVGLLKNARWVNPMLCFTRGYVNIPGNMIDGVHILAANDLVKTLLSLDRSL